MKQMEYSIIIEIPIILGMHPRDYSETDSLLSNSLKNGSIVFPEM